MSAPDNLSSIFVIIPAYNEQATLREVVKEVIALNYSVVIVDDGSEQSLAPLITDLPVYFLRHRVNLGQGAALQTGINFALARKASYLVTFDADGQHLAADIPVMMEQLRKCEQDIVLGSRFIKGGAHNMSRGRAVILKLARVVNYLFTGILLTDAHNGLRVMHRKTAQLIHLKENGMAHATEFLSLIKKNRLTYSEVPVTIQYTDYSRKKGQSLWGAFRIFFDLLLNKIFK